MSNSIGDYCCEWYVIYADYKLAHNHMKLYWKLPPVQEKIDKKNLADLKTKINYQIMLWTREYIFRIYNNVQPYPSYENLELLELTESENLYKYYFILGNRSKAINLSKNWKIHSQ